MTVTQRKQLEAEAAWGEVDFIDWQERSGPDGLLQQFEISKVKNIPLDFGQALYASDLLNLCHIFDQGSCGEVPFARIEFFSFFAGGFEYAHVNRSQLTEAVDEV